MWLFGEISQIVAFFRSSICSTNSANCGKCYIEMLLMTSHKQAICIAFPGGQRVSKSYPVFFTNSGASTNQTLILNLGICCLIKCWAHRSRSVTFQSIHLTKCVHAIAMQPLPGVNAITPGGNSGLGEGEVQRWERNYACLCMCACVCVLVYVHVCVCVHVRLCIQMRPCTSGNSDLGEVQKWEWNYVCLCMCAHVCVRTCVCACMCVHACVSLYTHASIHPRRAHTHM